MKRDHSNPGKISAARLPNLPDSCSVEKPVEPCIFIILGVTGDLSKRKLLPALFNLHKNHGLPDTFAVLGCGRKAMSTEAFRDLTKVALKKENTFDLKNWRSFSKALHYQRLALDDPESAMALSQTLDLLDGKRKSAGNRIFYLALPPDLYAPAVGILGKAGLGIEGSKGRVGSRLVVEKPFGYDLKSATALDRQIHSHFREHQVFRIDHYLAKETVQNILIFRFSNAVFEPLWNRRYIESIHIVAAETLGVEHRAGYYDKAGVIRDMFQNHMMQLLALTTMEPPSRFESEAVRDEKIKVFRALRPFPVNDLDTSLILGQYVRGASGRNLLPAYVEERGVSPGSPTPTYALMKVFLDNWRWQGVPIFMESGKRLPEKITEIVITFRDVPHCMFRKTLNESIPPNRLVLGIFPEEHIQLTFQTKNPGPRMCLRRAMLDFKYDEGLKSPALNAYEKVLIDCMTGDQILFWRQDGVEACWSFLTPILNACERCASRTDILHPYPAGGPRPAAAQVLLEK